MTRRTKLISAVASPGFLPQPACIDLGSISAPPPGPDECAALIVTLCRGRAPRRRPSAQD